jgi:hypothetical protein
MILVLQLLGLRGFDRGQAERGKALLNGNVAAQIFWLKNRRPSEWRDVQNINTDIGHYILSDRPMTNEQWIAERASADGRRKLLDVSPAVPDTSDDTDKPLE